MELLSGNEAIAQGAWEAGVHIGTAYPGTPSTETMECLAQKEGVYAEWCPNEKVALEVAVGASAAGARVLVSMKHVGVNVAADPLFTSAYTGVGGGMLILAADDPGMHSSQNEQDSRFYALAAQIPLLEPSDSQEALDYAREAYEFSERFDIPFFIRSTVRVSHAKTLVTTGVRTEQALKEYQKDAGKWVMMPAFAKPRRVDLHRRIEAIKEWAETCPFNSETRTDSNIGIICAGATYQHVSEVFSDANIFKLGLSWPLPEQALKQFASSVDKVYVIEEGSNFLSLQVSSLGINLSEPLHELPFQGELSPGLIREAFGLMGPEHRPAIDDLPGRPPALCPGCPHRLVFKELARLKAIVTGDIGCYTLAALPPLAAMDTCLDMGASVSMAHGFELAMKDKDHRPIVAVIGDSTFAHSGLSSLIGTVYNQGSGTVLVLDNRTTAMTGRQGNPFNGQTLQNRPSRELDIENLVRALGVSDIQTINPHIMKDVRHALKSATSSTDLSVIIFRAPCALLGVERQAAYAVNDSCTSCGVCISLGCPAISTIPENGQAFIDEGLCIGCGQCVQYCAFDAIKQLSEGEV